MVKIKVANTVVAHTYSLWRAHGICGSHPLTRCLSFRVVSNCNFIKAVTRDIFSFKTANRGNCVLGAVVYKHFHFGPEMHVIRCALNLTS